MVKFIAAGLFILLLCSVSSQAQSPAIPSIIFDTDMGPDYDDAGAITILHALADSGQARILATIASTRYEGVAGVLSVFNTYFGRPSIPIGVVSKAGLDIRDGQHWSDSLLKNYPHALKNNAAAEPAVELYRRLLAGEPDRSVTIVTVGFLTNLAELLESGADKHSRLSGLELVRQKVKLLVSMAGRFPSGREFNIFKDAPAAKKAFDRWPTPVLLSGFEIGMKIMTGLPLIQNDQITNSPAKDVFRISIPLSKEDSAGRKSWDQTAVLVAIKGHEPFYSVEEGRMIIAADGSNTWDPNGKGHSILVEKMPLKEVQAYLNLLMQHQPMASRK